MESTADALARIAVAREEGQKAFAAAQDQASLEAARLEFLGKRGPLESLMGLLKVVPPAERRDLGQAINALKQDLTASHAGAALRLADSRPATSGIDLSLPGIPPRMGSRHPLKQVEREVVGVLASLGFEVAEGPEVEDERHNFEALNIPADHPARDESESFYCVGWPLLLRSQTSTVQIRTMEAKKPPLRICAPGRVFRPDAVDATHMFMFHQVEGLAVERGLTLADLKSTLLLLFRSLFGKDVDIRLRPSFFPFTEPSAEVDVFFPERGWVEAGGCGMVDPAVFAAVGIDPEEWSGFAFGLGLERLAMRQLRVPDIRLFTENDARFLDQFR